jgi:hypothetical protein
VEMALGVVGVAGVFDAAARGLALAPRQGAYGVGAPNRIRAARPIEKGRLENWVDRLGCERRGVPTPVCHIT